MPGDSLWQYLAETKAITSVGSTQMVALTGRMVYKSHVTVELTNMAEDAVDAEWDVEIQSKVFKAVSDPVRLEILRYLIYMDRGITCSEIGSVINISKSAGSYHFRILREAGLTVTRKESREKYVAVNLDTINRYITNFIDNIRE
jgi:uncharacterized HTH-type transcriptional regulator yceK